MTVAQLLDNISSRELTEWEAYFSILAREEEQRELERQTVARMQRTQRRR